MSKKSPLLPSEKEEIFLPFDECVTLPFWRLARWNFASMPEF